MPHPLSLVEWVALDEVAKAFAAGDETREGFWFSALLDLARRGEVPARGGSAELPGYLNREALLRWCAQRHVAEGSILDPMNVTPPPHPAEDPQHPYHSRQLAAALAAWAAVAAQGPTTGRTFKACVLEWLAVQYPDLTQDARERVARVANPHPTGGPPRPR